MRKTAPSAFTLVELLVVIGIIVVLISIVVPILSGARDAGVRVRCMTNMRSLVQASMVYQSDWNGYLPHPNWSGSSTGWLYNTNYPGGWVQDKVKSGLLWRYHQQVSTYRCPLDSGPWIAAYPSSNLTSYLMNGAACGFGARTFGLPGRDFKPHAVQFWEPAEEQLVGYPPWNDGSSYPVEGITVRHGVKAGDGACVGLFGGGAEWMTRDEFKRLAAQGTKNRLWCSPLNANGR